MKVQPRHLVGPLVALALLFVTLQQTGSALRSSGTWSRWKASTEPPADPYSRLDQLLARTQAIPLSSAERDPFSYGRAPVVATTVRHAPHSTTPVVQPVRLPVLTAIIWDNDPRASVHWNDRDYSVRVNSLFDDFRVKNITRDQLILERAGESFVLQLPKKGE
jgi:hypothetical protein